MLAVAWFIVLAIGAYNHVGANDNPACEGASDQDCRAILNASLATPSPTPDDEDCGVVGQYDPDHGGVLTSPLPATGDDRFCPEESATPSATPTASASAIPTQAPSFEDHAGQGDGLGCATKDCSGNKVGSAPSANGSPNSPFDGKPVGWK